MAERLPQECIPSPRIQIVDADYILPEQVPNMPRASLDGDGKHGFNLAGALILCVLLLGVAAGISRGFELYGLGDPAPSPAAEAYRMDAPVLTAVRPELAPAPAHREGNGVTLGLETRRVTAAAAEYYTIRRENTLVPGLLITAVREDGPAAAAGVLPGDVLVGVGGMEVLSEEDLTAAESDAAGTVTLTVFRDGDFTELAASLPPEE